MFKVSYFIIVKKSHYQCDFKILHEPTSLKVQTIVIKFIECHLPTNIFNCSHFIKKEECKYYRKSELNKDMQFNFLVRVYMTD